MNRTTYLVAIPLWALPYLLNGDKWTISNEQLACANEWLVRICGDNFYTIHEPEDEDQPNLPMIPAFGELCESALCYFTIYHD